MHDVTNGDASGTSRSMFRALHVTPEHDAGVNVRTLTMIGDSCRVFGDQARSDGLAPCRVEVIPME